MVFSIFEIIALIFVAVFFVKIKEQILWFFEDFAKNPGLVILILAMVYVLLFIKPA